MLGMQPVPGLGPAYLFIYLVSYNSTNSSF